MTFVTGAGAPSVISDIVSRCRSQSPPHLHPAILARCPEPEDHHMLVEQQIAERRERARDAIAKVVERPSGQPYGDYSVKSASGKTYRVAMRGPGLFENYCSCPDFAVNTLGTRSEEHTSELQSLRHL